MCQFHSWFLDHPVRVIYTKATNSVRYFSCRLSQNFTFSVNISKTVSFTVLKIFSPIQGTGKTKTLVAAIVEIVNTTNDSVLVCCQSNAACDEIVQRLMLSLQSGQCYRMYATSIKKEDVLSSIAPFSNLHDGRCQPPSLRIVYQARVVACTSQTASYFLRTKKDPLFDPHHFSYLMLDEAACLEQPAALIPITGD